MKEWRQGAEGTVVCKQQSPDELIQMWPQVIAPETFCCLSLKQPIIRDSWWKNYLLKRGKNEIIVETLVFKVYWWYFYKEVRKSGTFHSVLNQFLSCHLWILACDLSLTPSGHSEALEFIHFSLSLKILQLIVRRHMVCASGKPRASPDTYSWQLFFMSSSQFSPCALRNMLCWSACLAVAFTVVLWTGNPDHTVRAARVAESEHFYIEIYIL